MYLLNMYDCEVVAQCALLWEQSSSSSSFHSSFGLLMLQTSSYRKIQTTINTFAQAERNSVTVDDSSSYDVLKCSFSFNTEYRIIFDLKHPVCLSCVVPLAYFEFVSFLHATVDEFFVWKKMEKNLWNFALKIKFIHFFRWR